MSTTPENPEEHPYGLTANDNPIPGGFTGTVPQFLEWIQEHLSCGGVRVLDPIKDSIGRTVRPVHLGTGGYSDDEALIGRIDKGLFSWMFWESTHRGGLFVYHVPEKHFTSAESHEWLTPPSDVFQEIHRARELVIRTPAGDEYSVLTPHGVQLSFSETDRDIDQPAGVLTIAPLDPQKG